MKHFSHYNMPLNVVTSTVHEIHLLSFPNCHFCILNWISSSWGKLFSMGFIEPIKINLFLGISCISHFSINILSKQAAQSTLLKRVNFIDLICYDIWNKIIKIPPYVKCNNPWSNIAQSILLLFLWRDYKVGVALGYLCLFS